MEESTLMSFLPLMIMQIPLIFFAYAMSKRLDMNQTIWTLLSVVPVVGFFAAYYIGYRWMLHIVDVLHELKNR